MIWTRRLPVILVAGALAAAACTPPGRAAPPGAALAHPVVKGKAGPFADATVTLRRTGSEEAGGFAGTLDAGPGRRFVLAGPDDPPDFFIVEPRAVIFTSVDGTATNGIVILYDSSQIGPGHGTDHKALVYKVDGSGAVRQPAVETRLEGLADAAAVRARLHGRR